MSHPPVCSLGFRAEGSGLDKQGLRPGSTERQGRGLSVFTMACCALHKLRFVAVKGFEGDTPDFASVLGAFAARRCKAAVSGDVRHRVPLCAEDVEATDDSSLFDDDGYLVGLCGKHAVLVVAEAVEGRACTGAICAAIHPTSGVSVPTPRCGRHVVGTRVYCDECFAIREETGETPAKPIRLLCADGDDGVSPLTEMGSAPGSGGPPSRTFRNIGAQLHEAQGGAGLAADSRNYGRPMKTAAGLLAADPGDEPGAGGDDSETQVAGSQTTLELVREEQRKWAEDEAVRRAKADAYNNDKFEGLRVQLANLMCVVGDLNVKLAADKSAKELPATEVPAATTSEGSRSERARGERLHARRRRGCSRVSVRRCFEAIKDARKLAEGVMDKVLGTAPPDDPTSSPIKRLEAQMAGGGRRVEKVSRSPKEVRATARSITEEIGEDVDEVLRVIDSRGRSLVERYGMTRAAERVADMFDLDCVSAVLRALEERVGETHVMDKPACADAEEEEFEGFESDEAKVVNDEEEDEGCESSSDHGPELVEYLRSDLVTIVQAHLVDDDLDDGKPPMRLRRLDNGQLLRASRHRVLRGADRRGLNEGDDEESVADARGARRQTSMLGGGGVKGTPSGLRAPVAPVRSGAASGASEPTRSSGTVDEASPDDVDLFANWGSVRSDGSQRTRTRSGAFGREVATSDDGSRVSELTDVSRPSGRSGTRSLLGSLAVGSGAGGMGRAKVEPGYEASGMPLVARSSTGEDISEQLKMATVTFDDGEGKKPMKKLLMPAVTTLKEVKEFDEVIFWILRGAGEKEHRPSYFPNILAVQVAEQVFNTVHEAAVSRLEYPFPIQMSPFVVLALITGSLGAQSFEGGSAQEVKAAGTHVYYYKGRCLMLDDIVLKEDMPDDWAEAEIQRGPLVWPSGNAQRSRVRVGDHTKSETLVRRIKAFAEVAGMFYNDVFQDQLEVLASDFESLAKQRANSRRIYPLVMLSVTYETLIYKFVVQLRSQAMKLLYHLEHMQKSVARPHVFQALRMVMKGRDKDFDMAWTWPSHLMDVTAPDSDFMRVYEEFKVNGMLAVTMGGMAAFSVPTTNKKPGTGTSGAGLADDDGLAGQDEAADVGAASPAAQKTKEQEDRRSKVEGRS